MGHSILTLQPNPDQAFPSGKFFILKMLAFTHYVKCTYLWALHLEIGKQRKVGGKVQAEGIQIGGSRFLGLF